MHYDFTEGTGTPLIAMEVEGDDRTINSEAVQNRVPAYNTGEYSGVIHGATNFSWGGAAASREFVTGTFLINNNADLRKSNLRVSSPSVNYSSLSALFDVQFSGAINDGILFGSLEKTSVILAGMEVTGAKGFNFGVNKRGKLFYQGFTPRGGDFIYTAHSLELSQRNLIGFSVNSNSVEMSRLDFLNDNIETENFQLNTNFIANNEEFYLGGAQQYFRGGPNGPSGEYPTFSGQLNRFAFFSGFLSPSSMMGLGSGLLGDYFINQYPIEHKTIATGFNQVETYRTGITGYEYEVTGTLEIATGREMETGSITAVPIVDPYDTGEGATYVKYYTLSNGSSKTFYKEELGFLHPDSGYQYLPTGDGAFATLGLRPVSGAIADYTETRGIHTGGSTIINLYGSIPKTGILPQISGVTQVAVEETLVIKEPDSSGLRLAGSPELFMKDFIFFLGERK